MLKTFINTLNLIKIMQYNDNYKFFKNLPENKFNIFKLFKAMGLVSLVTTDGLSLMQSFKFRFQPVFFKIKFLYKKSKKVVLSYKYLSRITKRYPGLILVVSSPTGIIITPGYISSKTGGRLVVILG